MRPRSLFQTFYQLRIINTADMDTIKQDVDSFVSEYESVCSVRYLFSDTTQCLQAPASLYFKTIDIPLMTV